jgi:hypothetical protein
MKLVTTRQEYEARPRAGDWRSDVVDRNLSHPVGVTRNRGADSYGGPEGHEERAVTAGGRIGR